MLLHFYSSKPLKVDRKYGLETYSLRMLLLAFVFTQVLCFQLRSYSQEYSKIDVLNRVRCTICEKA